MIGGKAKQFIDNIEDQEVRESLREIAREALSRDDLNNSEFTFTKINEDGSDGETFKVKVVSNR